MAVPTFTDDFEELCALLAQTTANLKRMSELQKHNRIQFGEGLREFSDALDDTRKGWVRSNC